MDEPAAYGGTSPSGGDEMKIAVCAKQIPHPDAPAGFEPGTKTLRRSGPLVLDEADSFGVEVARQLVEQAGGGEVTLVSIAPNGETDGLRTAFAIGADKAVLVSDPRLVGLDALGTAKVLAAVVRRVQPDLVLAATESTDGYTGTVPVQLAQLLGYPAVSFARAVQVEAGGGLRVERQTDEGYEEIACPLPAVISVTNGVVDIPYPSFKARMAAKAKPVDELTLDALELDPAVLGALGARQEVVSVQGGEEAAPAASAFASVFGAVEVSKGGNVVTDDGSGHEAIISALESWKAL